MQALILAAGMGKRLGRYTRNATKCMVSVNGKTLIERAIEALSAANIKKLVIVIGYKGDVLRDFLSEKFDGGKKVGMDIEYIENPVFDTTNNIYSLYLAREKLAEDDTILLESDLIYKSDIIARLLENGEPNLAVVSHFEPWMDGTCTLLDENGCITALLDKAHFDWKNTENYYKTVNIYKFSRSFSTQYYIPFLEAYQKAFGKNEYYEQVLKVLSFLSSKSLKALQVAGDDWYEIDDASDLHIAENRFASGKDKLEKLQHRYGGYWRFPQLKDFCYLVNPYFPSQKMVDELSASLKTLLTQYPSGAEQQSILAGKIFGVLSENIVVGNGAAELIASLGEKIEGKVVVPYPTFNEYPARFSHAEIVPLMSDKSDFSYTADDILSVVKSSGAKTVLLINPDNPSGNFIGKEAMLFLLGELKTLGVQLVFDESFIDFAEKGVRYSLLHQEILEQFENLVVVKSISKSYGVPGLRLGVLASADASYIKEIKQANAIWNINSFAEYYLQIYEKYKGSYESACDKIADERQRFIAQLRAIHGIFVYESQANFVLCHLECAKTAAEVAIELIEKWGIYIKDLTGKKCFEQPQFIRLAVRNREDNFSLITALKDILH